MFFSSVRRLSLGLEALSDAFHWTGVKSPFNSMYSSKVGDFQVTSLRIRSTFDGTKLLLNYFAPELRALTPYRRPHAADDHPACTRITSASNRHVHWLQGISPSKRTAEKGTSTAYVWTTFRIWNGVGRPLQI